MDHISYLLKRYLKIKYDLGERLSIKSFVEAQKLALYSDIKKQTNHGTAYIALENELICIERSYVWLKRRNNQSRNEATYCFLRDKNMFFGQERIFPL